MLMGIFNLFNHHSSNDRHRRDPGDVKWRKYEAKVAKTLTRKGIKVTARGKKIYDMNGKQVTDIDIQTKHANIETKTGTINTHIGRQLRKYKTYDSSREAIGMAPRLSENERKNLNKEGFNVFSHEKCLVSYLKFKNKNPDKTEIRPDPRNHSKRK